MVHALYVSEPPCGFPKLATRARVFVLCLEPIGQGTYCLNPVTASEENFEKIRDWTQQAKLRQRMVSVSAEKAEARLIHKVKPDYSSIAGLAKVQGDVVLQIVINAQGKVIQAQALSGHPLLTQEAIDAVLQWRYRPFFLDGSPVRAETSVRLCFLATPSSHPNGFGPRSEDSWQQVLRGPLAKVEVDRRLYERRKDEDCFIAVRVMNVTNRPVGVDLREFWSVIYPNSWGFSKTPAPEVVDEERLIRGRMSAADRKRLMLDYSENRLTTIMPHRSITYFRGFNVGHNIRKEIDSAGNQYLIVGLDGALQMTDGQTAEEMNFPANDGGTSSRWVAIGLPTTWQTPSQNSLVVEERRP